MKTVKYILETLAHIPINDQNQSIRCNLVRHLTNHIGADNCTPLEICLLCGNNFRQFKEKQFLLPAKKKNRFLRRLIKHQPDGGTLYQMRSMGKLQKYSVQQLAKYCQFCKYKFRRIIKNDQHNKVLKQVKKEETVASETNGNTVIKPKKKRKKDFAGLKTSAVLSVKRAHLANNLDGLVTPKKRKLNTSSAKLNKNASGTSSADKWDVLDADSDLIYIDKTPTNSGIGSKHLESPDFISLITPVKTENKPLQHLGVINLCTPNASEVGNEQLENSDFTSLIPPKTTIPTPSIDLETRTYKMAITRSHKRYKWRQREIKRLNLKKKRSKQNDDTSTPQNVKEEITPNNNQASTSQSVKKQNINTPNNSQARTSCTAKKRNTKANNNSKSISVKKQTKTNKLTKKGKKLNTLSHLLKDDTELNKTVSNLERFLNSIPTTK